MKNKAFTLIELLAVIIILGILMLIAIPSVTNYINNSRKSTYVTTVNELVKATTAKVNSGDLNMFDTDTTYYVPCTCIKLENGEAKSPYGKFDPAYIVVTFDGTNYHYYFTGKDVQNMGIPVLTSLDLLSKESIVANVEAIDTSVGIEGTSNVYVFSDECNGEGEVGPAGTTVPGGSSGSGSGSSSGGSGTTSTEYTISFNSNGGIGSMSSITCTKGTQCTLPTNKFNGDGHDFLGWSSSASGSVEYEDDSKVTDITSSSSITLYAVWDPYLYCPSSKCTYTYFYTSDIKYGPDGDNISSIEHYSNYKNIDFHGTYWRWMFLAYITDYSGKIERAFTCMYLHYNQPNESVFCIEGTRDGSKHSKNLERMARILTKDGWTSRGWGSGTMYISSDRRDMTYTDSTGYVYVSSYVGDMDYGCHASNNGTSQCD